MNLEALLEFKEISNVFVGDIPVSTSKPLLEKHGLPEDSEVLFIYYDPEYSESTIITDEFLSFDISDKIEKFYLENLNYFEINNKDEKIFLFQSDENLTSFPLFLIGVNSFLIDRVSSLIMELFNEFIEDIKSLNFETLAKKTMDEGVELIKSLEYDSSRQEKIDVCNKFLNIYDEFDKKNTKGLYFRRLEFLLIFALSTSELYDEALERIDESLKYELDTDLSFILSEKARLLENIGDFSQAIIILKKLINESVDNTTKIEAKNKLKDLIERYNESFIDLPKNSRKLLVVGDDFSECQNTTFLVLNKNNLPKNIKFPNNEVKSKELYIVHPHLKDTYLSFKSYEEEVALEKFREFFYFVQCLGAKKIRYYIKEGNSTDTSKRNNLNVDGSLSLGKSIVKTNIDGSLGKESSENNSSINANKTGIEQTFTPTKTPYLPQDLLYYETEKRWQDLYKQRTSGNNIKTFVEEISTTDSETYNKIEKMEIKVAFKNFFVDASLNIDTEIEETFHKKETKKWIMEIEFEDIKNLTEIDECVKLLHAQEKAMYTEEEKEYAEEFMLMLEDDGIIDEKERKYLERIRIIKGISEERALYIENDFSLHSSLKDNEAEYLDLYKDYLRDGEITDKERRILKRMATMLDLSDQEVEDLENSL